MDGKGAVAIELLRADHGRIRELFQALTRTRRVEVREREALVKRLKEALEIHLLIEEKVFYPVCHEYAGMRARVEGLEEGHGFIRRVLGDLLLYEVDSDEWMLVFVLLQETVDGHFAEEEGEGGVFVMAEEELGLGVLEEMAEEMVVQRMRAERSQRESWAMIMHPE